jgi:hypothetical protein
VPESLLSAKELENLKAMAQEGNTAKARQLNPFSSEHEKLCSVFYVQLLSKGLSRGMGRMKRTKASFRLLELMITATELLEAEMQISTLGGELRATV